MKNNINQLLIFIISTILLTSCVTSNIKKFEKRKKYSDNNSVLGLNSINADNNYYTKAVLDYLLVKKIIEGNSSYYFGMPEYLPVTPLIDSLKVKKIVLFPQLQSFAKKESKLDLITSEQLKEIGINYHIYDLPTKLKHLKSGFQFNHYVFKSTNGAALQAFGIINSEIKEKSLYIVIDYLQYQDIHCAGIPTIRYAVGMRAEFRVLGIESESELSGIGSLAGLAAQVETNKQQVNITIKTIGITGIDSRLSIPSTTSFDVKTYSDYEKILDFIRNLKDHKINNEDLIVEPQIIPVMDEYRTTIAHSLYPLIESIELLESKLNEIEKEGVNLEKVEEIKLNINKLKLELLEREVQKIIDQRKELIENDKVINNYSDIIKLFNIINDSKIKNEIDKQKEGK